MIWSKLLDDGSSLEVEDALLPLKGYREEREYTVIVHHLDGHKTGLCKVNSSGEPVQWWSSCRAAGPNPLEGLAEALTVDQVMET